MFGVLNKGLRGVLQLRSKAITKLLTGLVFVVFVLGSVLITKANNQFLFKLTPSKGVTSLEVTASANKLDKTENTNSLVPATLVCPTTPDIGLLEASIVITQPSCPDTDISVDFDINNEGNIGYTGDLSITFY
ncbi:MAG: hypothetical protein ACR2MX_13685, partial [Cyclobacteriaceae bacterium]